MDLCVWMRLRLNQLPYKTEDLAHRMLKGAPSDRISAQDSLQHLYFSTLPPPIMHLRDSESHTCFWVRSGKTVCGKVFFLFQPCPSSKFPGSAWRRRSETCRGPGGGSNRHCCRRTPAGDERRWKQSHTHLRFTHLKLRLLPLSGNFSVS